MPKRRGRPARIKRNPALWNPSVRTTLWPDFREALIEVYGEANIRPDAEEIFCAFHAVKRRGATFDQVGAVNHGQTPRKIGECVLQWELDGVLIGYHKRRASAASANSGEELEAILARIELLPGSTDEDGV